MNEGMNATVGIGEDLGKRVAKYVSTLPGKDRNLKQKLLLLQEQLTVFFPVRVPSPAESSPPFCARPTARLSPSPKLQVLPRFEV